MTSCGSSERDSAVGTMTELEGGANCSTAVAAPPRRRRAVAFSYSRVRPASSSTASSVTNGTGTPSSGGSDTSSSGETMEYTFVEDVPSDCCCGLCGELMEEPLQTQCCHTDYCQPCIQSPRNQNTNQEVINQDKRYAKQDVGRKKDSPKQSCVECPDCKSPSVKLRKNEELKKKINTLLVKCVYVSAGCVWEGERVWLKDHIELKGGCQYVPVICSDCSIELRKKDQQKHALSECKMRVTQCKYCSVQDTYETMTSHHYQECPNHPVKCTLDCGEMLPRNKLQDHMDNDCTSRGEQCPFRGLGCTESPIPSANMEAHVASCGVLHIKDMVKKFTSEIVALQNQVREIQTENKSLRREVESTVAAMETAEQTMTTLQARSDTLSKTLLYELEYYCKVKEPHELVAVECMKTQLASGLIHLQAGGSPATMRMRSYGSHKDSGQVWLSPPFYIHAGYKLRLAIHLNGVGAGKGSHVSIYLHQMAGERDDQLEWPYILKDRVKVSLLKQTEYQSPASTTATTSRGFFGRRPRLSSSADSTQLSLPLPRNASPLREPRKIVDEQRSPPIRDSETPVAIETQAMAVTSYLRRVDIGQSSLGGRVVSKVDLFCTQQRVMDAVYYDSLVFQCTLCSSNLTDGSIAC